MPTSQGNNYSRNSGQGQNRQNYQKSQNNGNYGGGYGGYNNQNRRDNQNFNSHNSRGSYERQPKTIVSYVEQQKAKGIDSFQKQHDLIKKPTGESSQFGKFDARSVYAAKSPLGFNGSIGRDEQKEKEMYAQVSNTGINFDKYDAIPVEVSGEGAPGPLESFNCAEAETMLPPRLMENLKLCGFNKPTPVQKHSIPIGLADRDLMACAQTGSGKTGGFLFPIISLLLRKGALVAEGGRPKRVARPNALVLGPTRELVVQIYEEAKKFCYATGLRTVVCYGGAKSYDQRNELLNGCDILVATPGRLIDFIERGTIELCCIQQLVLDEADRMLDMGFEPVIRQIVHDFDLPQTGQRRTFMFSATFAREIQRLASDFMHDYIFLTVGRVGSAATDITQTLQFVPEREKRDALMLVLNGIKSGLVLVFVQTKRNAEDLQYFLYNQGFPTASIHGDRTQHERESALKSFKNGETPILVATDVAARGLDIDNVTFVINFDLPGNIDDYVHRIGRTGRAGNKGNALSFFNEKNSNISAKLIALLKENDQEIPGFLRTYSGGGGGRGGYRQSNTRDYRSRNNQQGGAGNQRGYQQSNSGKWNNSRGNNNSSQQRKPRNGGQLAAGNGNVANDAW